MQLIKKYEKQSVFDVLLENSGAISGLFDFLKANNLSQLEIPSGEYKLEEVIKKDIVSFFEAVNAYNSIATGTVTAFADGSLLVEVYNSENTLIETKMISLADYIVNVPDSLIRINGVAVGNVPATTSKTFTVNLNGVPAGSLNPLTGEWDVEMPLPTGEWTRDPNWLPLPDISATDGRFTGLLLIFENEFNQVNLFVANGTATLDFGDGTSITSASGNNIHIYDYATISSPIHQYYDGRNYKQVIVNATKITNPNTFSANFDATLNQGGTYNFADVALNWANVSNPLGVRLRICEQVVIHNLVLGGITSGFQEMNQLQSVSFPYNKFLNCNAFMAYTGRLKIGNVSSTTITSLTNAWLGSGLYEIGDITADNCTGWAGLFSDIRNRLKVGNITSLNYTGGEAILGNAYGCYEVGVINQPLRTSLASFAQNARNLKKLIFTNCANVTVTTNAFAGMVSLTELILPNLTRGFSVANCRMPAAALNAMFSSLGPASGLPGSQTIIVTGNPGASTCNTAIATALGYPVAI